MKMGGLADDLSVILPRVLIASRHSLCKDNFVDFVGEYHLDLIVGYGAVPVIVPRVTGIDILLDSFEPIHGVLLCESEDIDLHLNDIDKEKDSIEFRLAKLCLHRNIPYLGICRGSQVLNVACGGTLYQAPQAQEQRVAHFSYNNRDTHVVRVLDNTPLHRWFSNSLTGPAQGQEARGPSPIEIVVMSCHQQDVKRLAQRFVPMAFAPDDGLIQALYDPDTYSPDEGKFIMGLQFYPESIRRPDSNDFDHPGCLNAYQEFVKAVIAYKKRLDSKTKVAKLENLDQDLLEKKRIVLVRSFSLAKDIYLSKCHINKSTQSELEVGYHFLQCNAVLQKQRERGMIEVEIAVRNALKCLQNFKVESERQNLASEIMGKMTVNQLSELKTFYQTMSQICSKVLEIKLRDGLVKDQLGL